MEEPTSTKLVDTLRDWTSLGNDRQESFERLVEIFSKEYFLIDKDYRYFPLIQLIEIIKSMIETDKYTSLIIMNILNKYIKSEDLLIEIGAKVDKHIDLLRVSTNDKIIKKRFKDIGIGKSGKESERLAGSDYNFIEMYRICKLLDTYTINIPEKINLMVEEILYLLNQFNSFFNSKNTIINKRILLTVFSYIFAVYSGEGIPEYDIYKAIVSAISKLESSTFLNIKILKNDQYKYANCLVNNYEFMNNEQKYTNIIAQYQKNGKINTHFKDMMRDLGTHVKSIYDLTDIMNLIYLYYVFTDKYKEFDDVSCKDSIKEFIKGVMNSNENNYENIEIISKTYIRYLMEFQYSLQADVNSSNKEISERALDVIKDITKVIEDIKDDVDDYKAKYEGTPMEHDKLDDGLGFTGLSDYEKEVLQKFTESEALFNSLIINQEDFNNSFGNPEVLQQCDPDLLEKVAVFVLRNPEMVDRTKFVNSINDAYKSLSNRVHDGDASVYNQLNELKLWQNKFKDSNQDDMYDDIRSNLLIGSTYKDTNKADMDKVEEFDINDIKSVNAFIDTNKYAMAKVFTEAFIINNASKEISTAMQEMKVMSYVNLALDKAKQAYDTFNDKQKEFFVSIDRIAQSVSTWNDKEESDDARYRIVNQKILPSLSKCIKTVLAAGALALFVNVYAGMLALAVKFVMAKNAGKKERQALADELEVELEMIDKRIANASDNNDNKEERKLRLLKKKLSTQYGRIVVKNITKWDNSVVLKSDIDAAGSRMGLKEY